MEGNRGPPAPASAQATMSEEEVNPVSSAAPHHGYGLRSREGGQLDRPGRPRESGGVRSAGPQSAHPSAPADRGQQ